MKVLKTVALFFVSNTLFAKQQLHPGELDQAGNSAANPVSVTLSIVVLSFGFLLMLAVLIFLYKSKKGFGNLTFKILGIILIATASLFLIVAGYSNDQITPVIGLLGTVAGYIFGSNINAKLNEKDP